MAPLVHITSLKPLRPANAPDAWEAAALRSFEQGRTEASSHKLLHGQPYLRFMKPLVPETSCLKCHAGQGYHEGHICGGISVAVPLDPDLALAQTRIVRIAGIHAGLWALGALGILLGARQMRQRLDQQLQAEEQLRQSEEKFRTVADWTYDLEIWRGPDGRLLYVSPSAERITGYRAGEFLADPELTLKITHPDDLARVTEHHQKVSQPGNEVCSLDFRILTRGGEERWINHHCQPVYDANGRWLGQRSGNRDITERKRMEERLRETADRLALATRVGGVGIWDYDVVNNKLVWDDQMFCLYGITREQFGGAYEAWHAGVHPEDRQRAHEEIQRALRGEKDFDTEFRVLWPDGSTHDIRAIATVERDATGKALRMVGTNWDVTERKLAKESLRYEQALMATLMENVPDAVYFKDAASRFIRANQASARKLGLSDPAQLIGKSDADFFNRERARQTRADEKEIIRTGQPLLNVEEKEIWLDGSVDWVLTTKLPLRDAAGHIIGTCGISRDITERKRMEEKLRQLSVAVEQSPASIVITNTAGDIEYVNPKFIEITGYTLAEVLGKNPRVLKSGEKSPEAYRELWETISAGKEWRGEFHNKKKNGELYWEFASISPIRDPAGNVTHYVAVKEDITGRKNIEADRDQLIHHLQEALANVKSLSGMLPICAGCKKIRDDKGYWSQVESYIQSHSEAKFSHGMCPDCLKKWYPDLVEAGLGNSTKEKP